jgi:hypothetical protein
MMKLHFDALEMVSKSQKSMYRLLETVAEREIERDPIGFIRDESFIG